MARSKQTTGVVEAKTLPRGKPSGIADAMNIAAPLESGIDITHAFGPDKLNPPRGLKPPAQGPHRPR
jgi:hypothetical protein